MAVKTYRYKWKPILGIESVRFATAPTAAEITGGPYTVDVTLEESEKAAMDHHMAGYCWEFDEEVV